MPEDEGIVVTGKVLKWGNSYGLRLKKTDVERAGLKPGAEAVVRIGKGKVDLSHVTFYRGEPSDAERLDELLAESREAKLAKSRRR